MDIEEANKILAKACSVDVEYKSLAPYMQAKLYMLDNTEWTIEDARCREVIDKWWLNSELGREITHTSEGFWYEEPDGIDGRCSDIVAYAHTHEDCMIKIAEGE